MRLEARLALDALAIDEVADALGLQRREQGCEAGEVGLEGRA